MGTGDGGWAAGGNERCKPRKEPLMFRIPKDMPRSTCRSISKELVEEVAFRIHHEQEVDVTQGMRSRAQELKTMVCYNSKLVYASWASPFLSTQSIASKAST